MSSVLWAEGKPYNGGMVYRMKRMVRLGAYLIIVWVVFVTAFRAVTFGHAEEDARGGAVFVTAEALDPAEGEWIVCLSRGLCELAGERDLALLINLEASEGYTVEAVEPGEGAEGLTLTVGTLPARSVAVLLDGRIQAGAEGAILRVKLSFAEEDEPLQGGYMGVTGGRYGEFALYTRNEAGEVELIPLVWMSGREEETEDVTAETAAEPEETAAEERDTVGAVTRESDETETVEPRPIDRFLGCRETAVKEGRFAVQFLFSGSGRDTPVICLEGGGVLSLEVTYMEDGVSFCTFRGMDGEGSYVFWVYTEQEWISVRYEKGRFCGFSQNTAHQGVKNTPTSARTAYFYNAFKKIP